MDNLSSDADLKKVKRRLAMVYVLGALTGAVVIVSMACSYRTAVRMSANDIPQLGAAGEIALAVSGAHRRSTGMPGDDDHEFDEIRPWLDSARVCTQALLYGGQTTHGAIPPLKDEVLRQVAAGMDTLLADFTSLTRERHERPGEFDGGAKQQYDQTYDEIMGKTGTLTAHLRDRIDADLGRSRVVQATIIGLCALGLTAATYIAGLLVRRHSLDATRLMAVNQQLQAHQQQLLAANQQLQAGEQQLRATNQQLRAANQQFAASEARLRSIIDSSPMGMYFYQLTEDGRLILTGGNPAADRLIGTKSHELVGKTIEDAFPALADTEIPARYRAAAAEGTSWQTFSLDYSEGPITGCFDVWAFQTLPGRMAVVFAEISQRRQSERALYALTCRNEAILAAVPDIITEVDCEKKLVWLNAAALDFYGEDAVGKTADYYFEGEQDTYSAVAPLFEGDENVVYVESWQRRKDGEKRLLAWWCRVLKDADGAVTGALSTARDVTEEMQARQEREDLLDAVEQANRELRSVNQQLQAGEQQLRAANQQLQAREREYRLLFSEMISGFAVHEMIYDEDGNPVDYRFLEINAAFEALTGLTRADVVGRTATEVLPKIDRFWITTYGGVATTGKPVHFEHYSKDVAAYFDVIAYRPAQGQFAAIFNNVTERRLAERELKRLNRNLDSRNRELQSIVYAASHDLRSPLVNIQGFGGELAEYCRNLRRLLSNVQGAEEWRKEVNGVIEKDVPEALSFIRAGARKMQTLLDGLLSVSRIGSVELAMETLDMEALLLSVIAATRFQIDTLHAEVIVNSLPPCRGDAAQVNQVFSNLIANALKYAAPARNPRVCITGVIEEDEVIYCVEDNGMGIAPQYQENIFEIFHRLNPGDAHDGEGIGLTIVSRIVDRHDGRVWVESEEGKGSRFFVALPKA